MGAARSIWKTGSNGAKNSSDIQLGVMVLVAGLGYFVDIYDLLLFGIVRVASLKGIGLHEKDFLEVGILLVNLQMFGMLLGGVVWGVLGDKKGRISVLFGSILIYSIANILNAFVSTVWAYGALRLLAGFGLAGELGAAVTLVSESLSKERRGLGTTVVATLGIMGAVFAGLVSEVFDWRTAYLIGGAMGLVLLIMRLSIHESGMFKKLQTTDVKKGDLRILFNSWSQCMKYARCILVGVPIWFVVGILITFSPELAKEIGVLGAVTSGRAILFCYLGASLGNLICGILSQALKSRRKVVFLSLFCIVGVVGISLFTRGLTLPAYYALCFALGLSTGYWVIFMNIAAEQFGTNLRATVTTTAPNFVRASVVLLTFSFNQLRPSLGLIQSAWVIGLVSVAIAGVSLIRIKETFGKDLNFVET